MLRQGYGGLSGRTWIRTTDLLHVRRVREQSATVRRRPKLLIANGFQRSADSAHVRRIPPPSDSLATTWLQVVQAPACADSRRAARRTCLWFPALSANPPVPRVSTAAYDRSDEDEVARWRNARRTETRGCRSLKVKSAGPGGQRFHVWTVNPSVCSHGTTAAPTGPDSSEPQKRQNRQDDDNHSNDVEDVHVGSSRFAMITEVTQAPCRT